MSAKMLSISALPTIAMMDYGGGGGGLQDFQIMNMRGGRVNMQCTQLLIDRSQAYKR